MSDSKIKFAHYRLTHADGTVVSRGGITLAYQSVTEGEKSVVRFATAKCSPSDNYSKVLGAKKAGGRLLSKGVSTFEGTERQLLEAVDRDLGVMNREAQVFGALEGLQMPLMLRKFGKKQPNQIAGQAVQATLELPNQGEGAATETA